MSPPRTTMGDVPDPTIAAEIDALNAPTVATITWTPRGGTPRTVEGDYLTRVVGGTVQPKPVDTTPPSRELRLMINRAERASREGRLPDIETLADRLLRD